ncbi:MAG: hypothetical protein M1828_002569 [Chrysothrix sp. TS-e1954]|nr:MAG: hypothetical protein M1828_002569 [Chrysothrix sp. TS-e1954]
MLKIATVAVLTLPWVSLAVPSPLQKLLSWSHEHTFKQGAEGPGNALCFYDKVKIHSGQCPLALSTPYPGRPDQSLCSQARDAVCHALSLSPQGQNSTYFAHVGNGTLHGDDADCYAIASNSDNPYDPMGLLADGQRSGDQAHRFHQCRQQFQELQDCSEPKANAGYNAQCVGGTIGDTSHANIPDIHPGRHRGNSRFQKTNGTHFVLDVKADPYRRPRFGLGSPLAFGFTQADHATITPPNFKVDLKSRSILGAFPTKGWGHADSVLDDEPATRVSMPGRGNDVVDTKDSYERWKGVTAATEAREAAEKDKKHS